MKRAYYLPIALVVLAVAVSMPSLATQQVTVRGEIIDSVCFIKSGARGSDHRGWTMAFRWRYSKRARINSFGSPQAPRWSHLTPI